MGAPLAEMDEGDVRHAADPNAQALTKVRLFGQPFLIQYQFVTPIPVRCTLFQFLNGLPAGAQRVARYSSCNASLERTERGSNSMAQRAEQFREFANDCLKWAKEARTEVERRDFLYMASASRRAADEYEGVALPGYASGKSSE